MKDYLLKLLTACAPDNGFAQDAIEYAIFTNRIQPTMNLEADIVLVMSQYDILVPAYQKHLNAQHARTLEIFGQLLPGYQFDQVDHAV